MGGTLHQGVPRDNSDRYRQHGGPWNPMERKKRGANTPTNSLALQCARAGRRRASSPEVTNFVAVPFLLGCFLRISCGMCAAFIYAILWIAHSLRVVAERAPSAFSESSFQAPTGNASGARRLQASFLTPSASAANWTVPVGCTVARAVLSGGGGGGGYYGVGGPGGLVDGAYNLLFPIPFVTQPSVNSPQTPPHSQSHFPLPLAPR
jgi:hypothetical protein